MEILIDSRLRAALEAISEIAPESYVVGGAIRDALLRRNAQVDLDVAVDGDGYTVAGQVARAITGATFVPLDERHGTGRVVLTKGRAAELDISSFKGPSILEDLRLRDFTINAMAVTVPDYLAGDLTELLDPCHGRQDLVAGKIRACADQAFQDDPLRILRAFRFKAELGFEITEEARGLLLASVPALAKIAPERIRDEFMLILAQDRCFPVLLEMDRAGLMDALFAELSPMRGLAQNYYHHLDVWDHTLEAVNQLEQVLATGQACFGNLWPHVETYLEGEPVTDRPRRALLKLAAIFHDVGKPHTVSHDPSGRIRFFDHEETSRKIFEDVGLRFKLAAREIRVVSRWIEGHMRPMFLAGSSVSKKAVLRLRRKLGEDLIGLLLLYLADVRASQGPAGAVETDELTLERVCWALGLNFYAEKQPASPLLGGRDLISIFGIPPGPFLGSILKRLAELQDSGEISTRKEAVSAVEQFLKEESR